MCSLRTPRIRLHFWGIFTDGDNWITLWCGSPRKVVGTGITRIPPWSLPNSPQLCNVWKKGYDSNILVSVNHTTWKMVFGFVVFTFRRKYTYFKYKIVLGFSFNLIFCISHSWLYEMTIAIARYTGLFKIKHRKTKKVLIF